jgi:hypothetical protein
MYKSHAVQLDKCDATGLNGSNFAKAQKHKSPAGAHLQGLFLIHEKILLWRKYSNPACNLLIINSNEGYHL